MSPQAAAGSAGARTVDLFRLLGRAMAKALQDGRLLDLPLSYVFYRCCRGICGSMRELNLGLWRHLIRSPCRRSGRCKFEQPPHACWHALLQALPGSCTSCSNKTDAFHCAGWHWAGQWTATTWAPLTPISAPRSTACAQRTRRTQLLASSQAGWSWWMACPWTTCASPSCCQVLACLFRSSTDVH